MTDIDLKKYVDNLPFTSGVIRKIPISLAAVFTDQRIVIAAWQILLAENNFDICSHLTYKIHSQNNASIPLLPFCSIEDKWIKEIYLSNDEAQAGVSIDIIVVHPPTKLNYTGIYSQTIDTEGSITSILSAMAATLVLIEENTRPA